MWTFMQEWNLLDEDEKPRFIVKVMEEVLGPDSKILVAQISNIQPKKRGNQFQLSYTDSSAALRLPTIVKI